MKKETVWLKINVVMGNIEDNTWEMLTLEERIELENLCNHNYVKKPNYEMKYLLKLLTGTFFLPFLILGGIIAVVKTLIIVSFGLAWQKGDDWHRYLLMKLNDFMEWIKQ